MSLTVGDRCVLVSDLTVGDRCVLLLVIGVS